jgi:hypothetical protein
MSCHEQQPISFCGRFANDGCAVCNHVMRIAHDFFAHWQYALASEETAQSDFAGITGRRSRFGTGSRRIVFSDTQNREDAPGDH